MDSAPTPDKLSEEVPRLIPGLIDERAKATPNRVYASIPVSDDVKDGWQDITYSMLQQAVDKMAWWLDENVPRVGEFDVLTYYGANDLRYPFLTIAVQKSRRVLLHLHDNNTHAGDLTLLDSTSCHTILVDANYTHRFTSITTDRPHLPLLPFPPLKHWLTSTPTTRYPYTAPPTFATAQQTPWLIGHTSGTTGQPKQIPIPIANQQLIQRMRHFSDSGHPDAFSRLTNKRFLLPWPFTWIPALAIITDILFAFEYIPVLLPARSPKELASPEYLREVLEVADVTSALVVPLYLKAWAKMEGGLDVLKRLEFVGYAGAGLEGALGEVVSRYTKVQCFYGATDVGTMPMLASRVEDGRYVGLSEEVGCVLEPVGEVMEGREVCELVLKRERDVVEVVPLFRREPGLKEHRTNDLFVRHPDGGSFWLPVGRRDDLTKNANLTKFNAGQVEALIEMVSSVRGVLVGGWGEPKPFVLVEVDALDNRGGAEGVRREVWPKVEEANEILTEELRIEKARIVVTDIKVRPLPRLGKGTVNRREALEMFAEDIAAFS